MQKIRFYYISLSGNTSSFVQRVSQYIKTTHHREVESLNIKDLKGKAITVDGPFVSFLPTYLEGGNGIDTGFQEILTGNLRKFLEYQGNFRYCLGIIGSGNRNFNKQFCLTAFQYAEQFGFPVIDVFELRGTDEDVERISKHILANFEKVEEKIDVSY
ncbi:class Ib ribonucleoside-diphosphate reductase assembly flavoprotein NrdI [Streptococcus oralis]|uniref:Putative NrdI-like protein n=1 Tax=Streptococcus oralis subsp. tigurinus TaxID=1077464 RepID=A0A1X1G4F2_STROR|nr:class Ib ribonucleoside-diphosphate reductase assembly flavoprotein NrdI [Streptococcus oralis]ORO41574.1 ribonucleotide reductase assembly protein NrdI [Streptococcus oralis subsp. tigurinus]